MKNKKKSTKQLENLNLNLKKGKGVKSKSPINDDIIEKVKEMAKKLKNNENMCKSLKDEFLRLEMNILVFEKYKKE